MGDGGRNCTELVGGGGWEPRAKMKKAVLNHVLGGWCCRTAEKSVRYYFVHHTEGGLQKDQGSGLYLPQSPHPLAFQKPEGKESNLRGRG